MATDANHPIVILIRGLPGSGKTHLAKALQKEIGEDRVVMLDPDGIDTGSQEYLEHVKALTAEGVDKSLHLYRFSRVKAYQGIEDNKVIIWNQPFTNLEIFHKMAGRLKDHAAAHKKRLAILVVEVELDHHIAKARVWERKKAGGHGPSDATWARFTKDYKSFAGAGYDTVTVHGNEKTALSVARITNALQPLLRQFG